MLDSSHWRGWWNRYGWSTKWSITKTYSQNLSRNCNRTAL